MPKLNGKNEVMLLLNGLQVDKLKEVELDRKLRRMYRKMLNKEPLRQTLR